MKLSAALIAWTPAFWSDCAEGKIKVGPDSPEDWAEPYACCVRSSGDDEAAFTELMLTFAGLAFDGAPIQRIHQELLAIDEYASVWGGLRPRLHLVN